jgi:hypothetical protein
MGHDPGVVMVQLPLEDRPGKTWFLLREVSDRDG